MKHPIENLTLPQNVKIITEKDRDRYDQYILLATHIHCHLLIVKQKSAIEIMAAHTSLLENAQDHTIRVWFSTIPYGDSIFQRPPLDRFTLNRSAAVVITLEAKMLPEGSSFCFMNFENLENRENNYKVIFKRVENPIAKKHEDTRNWLNPPSPNPSAKIF